MAELGADVLKETIEKLVNGTLARTPQDEEKGHQMPYAQKEDGKLAFDLPVKVCMTVCVA